MKKLSDSPQTDEVRWQICVDGCVKGPYTPAEMAGIFRMGILTEESLIMQLSWARWHKCGDVLKAFRAHDHARGPTPLRVPAANSVVAKRLSLDPGVAEVLIHDQKNLVRTFAVNISKSGMFVATDRLDISLSSVISVTVKAPGVIRPFNARARVIRFNGDRRYPVGYGLEFLAQPEVLLNCYALD